MSKSSIHRNNQKDEGFIRLDLHLDKITYGQIIFLAERSGYDLSNGNLSEGITAVITHAIQRMSYNFDKIKNARDKQYRLLLSREILLAIDNNINCDEIADRFNRKRKLRYKCHKELTNESSWLSEDIANLAKEYIQKRGFPIDYEEKMKEYFRLTEEQLTEEINEYIDDY